MAEIGVVTSTALLSDSTPSTEFALMQEQIKLLTATIADLKTSNTSMSTEVSKPTTGVKKGVKEETTS